MHQTICGVCNNLHQLSQHLPHRRHDEQREFIYLAHTLQPFFLKKKLMKCLYEQHDDNNTNQIPCSYIGIIFLTGSFASYRHTSIVPLKNIRKASFSYLLNLDFKCSFQLCICVVGGVGRDSGVYEYCQGAKDDHTSYVSM